MASSPSFETFVVTRTTAPAVHACRKVPEDLPTARGIVLLHVPSGTGKTHLLRGVMHGLLMQLGAAMRWRTKNAAAAAVARLYPARADA